MSIVTRTEPLIREIWMIEDTITANLVDGHTISVPLAWSWRLSDATPEQRAHFEIIGDGQGVHWPDIDEDISALAAEIDAMRTNRRKAACAPQST